MHSTEHHGKAEKNPEVNFEPKDTNIGAVIKVTAVFVFFGIIGPLVFNVWYKHFLPAPTTTSVTNLPDAEKANMKYLERDNQPKLQANQKLNPISDVNEVQNWKNEEAQYLKSYTWVDKNKQIAKIPIEDAMAQMLKKGYDSRKATSGAPALGSGSPSTASTVAAAPTTPAPATPSAPAPNTPSATPSSSATHQ
jgi:hypothetical protein